MPAAARPSGRVARSWTRRWRSIASWATPVARATSCGASAVSYYFTADARDRRDMVPPVARRSIGRPGNRTMEAWSLHMIALSQVGQRHFDEARPDRPAALQHFHEAGDVSGVDTLPRRSRDQSPSADGDAARAGRLWGAARRLQQTTGTGLADYVKQTQQLFGVPTPEDVARRGPREARRGGRGDGPRRDRGVRSRGDRGRATVDASKRSADDRCPAGRAVAQRRADPTRRRRPMRRCRRPTGTRLW